MHCIVHWTCWLLNKEKAHSLSIAELATVLTLNWPYTTTRLWLTFQSMFSFFWVGWRTSLFFVPLYGVFLQLMLAPWIDYLLLLGRLYESNNAPAKLSHSTLSLAAHGPFGSSLSRRCSEINECFFLFHKIQMRRKREERINRSGRKTVRLSASVSLPKSVHHPPHTDTFSRSIGMVIVRVIYEHWGPYMNAFCCVYNINGGWLTLLLENGRALASMLASIGV